jgi:cytochrome c peroxidase
MKRLCEFKPAALRVFWLARTLLLSFAFLLPSMNSVPAEEPQRQSADFPSADDSDVQALSAVAQLGRKMFFDKSLSGSGQLACASCHDPSNAFAPKNTLAVQLGGADGKQAGVRAVPSLTYHEHTPLFRIGPDPAIPDNDERLPPIPTPADDVKVAAIAKADAASAARDAAEANVPQGGLTSDGRAMTIQGQALLPLLDPNEMNNRDVAEVVDHLKHAPYAEDLTQLFGPTLFLQPALALDEALFALVRFQLEERSFHPYDSKYDAYLAGKANLSEAEARGLKLFDDPKKGNCASCHIDTPSRIGHLPPAFTDYQFEALAAPRNKDIPANQDPDYYDLGLCGPYRKDFASAGPYCGLFKTPSLRNVATRKVFFHNGVFHSLEEVLHFYVERETNPGKWYPRLANGEIDRYNDLPPQYKKNADIADAPFDRKEGDTPALNDAEIADVIAFLNTLTDGYRPHHVRADDSAGATR